MARDIDSGSFTICVVGRPNVGKSTLFNKLTKSRRAIVDDYAGVTRDRLFGYADLEGVSACLIDTGGLELDAKDIILSQIREQAMLAIEEADVILFVVDGRAGLTNIDEEIGRQLRKSGKRTILAVNKMDNRDNLDDLHDFYSLGLDEVLPISAEHSLGLLELADALTEGREKDLYEDEEEPELWEDAEVDDEAANKRAKPEKPPTIAVVGRPNAGKSSLINRLMGEKRLMVSDIPGTTRDSIDTIIKWHGKELRFVDTAGIRKKNRITQKLEKFSVIMALKSISRCNLALLVIDATRGVSDQESKIAGIIHQEAKACIILINKWDLVEKESNTMEEFTLTVREKLPFLTFAPVVFISAETGQRTGMVFEKIEEVMDEYRKRVSTGELNRKLVRWIDKKAPPVVKGRRGKIFYASQTKASPPIFNFVVNGVERMTSPYKRYLVNRIRDEYGFEGAPVVCRFMERKGRR